MQICVDERVLLRVNERLKARNLAVANLSTDFCNGNLLNALLEELSGEKLPRWKPNATIAVRETLKSMVSLR